MILEERFVIDGVEILLFLILLMILNEKNIGDLSIKFKDDTKWEV